MNRLQAGFARVDITPELGVSIDGYYVPRKAERILDALEANCLVLRLRQRQKLHKQVMRLLKK